MLEPTFKYEIYDTKTEETWLKYLFDDVIKQKRQITAYLF